MIINGTLPDARKQDYERQRRLLQRVKEEPSIVSIAFTCQNDYEWWQSYPMRENRIMKGTRPSPAEKEKAERRTWKKMKVICQQDGGQEFEMMPRQYGDQQFAIDSA
ncbi:hypothetical protein CEXT_15361 [Caerostris extrusa]|uniref:Uncharacterized protein n=1 Tax=Caerostris extrusa TaxID=172846 RepID=A0AAV4VCY0_CAEEX|nr:hypothetical protein CEXT_15361 [Caerostris extrusa]